MTRYGRAGYVVAPEVHGNHRHGATEVRAAAGEGRGSARHAGHDGFQPRAQPGLPGPRPRVGPCPRSSLVRHRRPRGGDPVAPATTTFDKLDFYQAHGVQELLVLDWRDRSVRCFALQEGQVERDRSQVLGQTNRRARRPPSTGHRWATADPGLAAWLPAGETGAVSDSTLVVWDEVFTHYDFGPTHPLRPLRLELTMALAGQLGGAGPPGRHGGAPDHRRRRPARAGARPHVHRVGAPRARGP